MYIALYVVLGILAIIFTFLFFLYICSLIAGKKERNKDSKFYRGILYFCTSIALWLIRVKVKVIGEEKLKDLDRFLLVQNHISGYDPIITWYALKKQQLAFITKKENYKVFIFGKIVRRCCFRYIDRVNPKNAIRTINDCSELIKNEVVSFGVYPEGTRSKTGDMGAFHDGVFKIAVKAQCPVVITRVTDTNKIKKNIPFRRSRVLLEILDVIPTDKVITSTSHELSSISKETIEKEHQCA